MNNRIALHRSSSLALAAAAVALSCSAAFAVTPDNPVNGAVQGSAPVSVVNVPTVTVGNTPLPVTGNVSVSGTIDARQSGPWSVGASQSGPWSVGASQSGPWSVGASQSGTWFVGATQVGTWNVGILGTPTVKVDLGSSPLPVRNVNDAADVFQTSMQRTAPDNICCVPVGSFTVPIGKRLVIEDVSVDAEINNELATVHIVTTAAGNTVDHPVVALQTGANQEAAAGRLTRLYADGGTTVEVNGHRYGLAGPATFVVSLSGYYVPMP